MADKKKVELNEENLEEVAGGAVFGVNTEVDTKVKTNRSGNKSTTNRSDNTGSKVTTKEHKVNNRISGENNRAGLQGDEVKMGNSTNFDLTGGGK